MEQNVIRIKCPRCGAVLSVKDEPGLNEKSTTCPVCKQKSQIKDFKRVAVQQEDRTQYPGMGGTSSEQTTTIADKANYTLGRVAVLSSGSSYQLRPGRNVIGRKHSEGEHADFEIVTNSKRMSRLHLVIDVRKVAGTGYVHYVSLYGQRANATFVGNSQLEVGDCLVLNDGDIIRLPDQPDISVKFEVPDSDKTIID